VGIEGGHTPPTNKFNGVHSFSFANDPSAILYYTVLRNDTTDGQESKEKTNDKCNKQ